MLLSSIENVPELGKRSRVTTTRGAAKQTASSLYTNLATESSSDEDIYNFSGIKNQIPPKNARKIDEPEEAPARKKPNRLSESSSSSQSTTPPVEKSDLERFVTNRDKFARGEEIVTSDYVRKSAIIITKRAAVTRPAEEPLQVDSPGEENAPKRARRDTVKQTTKRALSEDSFDSVSFGNQSDNYTYENIDSLLDKSRPKRAVAQRRVPMCKFFFCLNLK
jgi:hypothetical protein